MRDLLIVECVLSMLLASRMKLISRIALRNNRCGLIFRLMMLDAHHRFGIDGSIIAHVDLSYHRV